MICILGSSFSRGAHGDDSGNTDNYIHNMLHKSLDMSVVNLSISGHGCEIYTDAFVYACNNYKPSVIVAEIWYDRSYNWLWLPTDSTKKASNKSIQEIYDGQFAEGHNDGKDYNWKELWNHKIFRNITDSKTSETFKTSEIQYHSMGQLLQMYNILGVYSDHEYPLQLRTIRRLMNLEAICKLVGIPVLWWTYLDNSMFRIFSEQLPSDRHLNTWSGINTGTCEWAEKKLQGQHLADNWHLNNRADRLVLEQLTVPWLRHWFDKNSA